MNIPAIAPLLLQNSDAIIFCGNRRLGLGKTNLITRKLLVRRLLISTTQTKFLEGSLISNTLLRLRLKPGLSKPCQPACTWVAFPTVPGKGTSSISSGNTAGCARYPSKMVSPSASSRITGRFWEIGLNRLNPTFHIHYHAFLQHHIGSGKSLAILRLRSLFP